MIKIALVRHGHTKWNDEERIQGHTNIGLSARGRIQIEALVSDIQSLKPDVVYSSPLVRAMESAEILAKRLGLKVIPIRQLTELDVGEWLGKTGEELKSIKSWIDYNKNPLGTFPVNGESFSSLCNRVTQGMQVVLESGHKRIVIVTHADVIRIAICRFIGLPLEHMHSITISVGSVSLVKLHRGRSQLVALNHPLTLG
jgi:alpha-ribazole phosphatase